MAKYFDRVAVTTINTAWDYLNNDLTINGGEKHVHDLDDALKLERRYAAAPAIAKARILQAFTGGWALADGHYTARDAGDVSPGQCIAICAGARYADRGRSKLSDQTKWFLDRIAFLFTDADRKQAA